MFFTLVNTENLQKLNRELFPILFKDKIVREKNDLTFKNVLIFLNFLNSSLIRFEDSYSPF